MKSLPGCIDIEAWKRRHTEMEIATVEGHGRERRERYAGAGNEAVLVAGRQTAQKTFAVPVGDGRIAVGRVEESVTVAMHEDESGHQRAVLQVARKLHVTGISSMMTLGRRSQRPEADEDEGMGPVQRCFWATLFLLTTAVYLAMMSLGTTNFHACTDTRLAIYVVVQGATASLNAAIGALVIICKCGVGTYLLTFMIIYIFNLIWSGIGCWWMSVCTDETLFHIALGFTVPIWTPIPVLCCIYCCWIWGCWKD